MNIELDTNSSDTQIIRAYEPGMVTIQDQKYHQSLIISAHQLIIDWEPNELEHFQLHHWDPILQLNPDIIILGVGDQQRFLSPALLMPVLSKKIGIEMMTNRSACHTYNALVAENRRVVAGVLLGAAHSAF